MTREWREPEDIAADLASGNAERLVRGLDDLRFFEKDGDEFELPLLDISLFALLGDPPPKDAIENFVHLLPRYRSFVPMPSRDDVIVQLVELAVRYAGSMVIYAAHMQIQLQPDPPAATRLALDYLGTRGLTKPSEIEAARMLVFYLLEAKQPVRQAVGEAIAAWPASEARRTIVKQLRPMFEPDQRALVTPEPRRS